MMNNSVVKINSLPSPLSVPLSFSDKQALIFPEAPSEVKQVPILDIKRSTAPKPLKSPEASPYKKLFINLSENKTGVDSKKLLEDIKTNYSCYNHSANGGKGRALLSLLNLFIIAKPNKGFKGAQNIESSLYDFLRALNPRGKIYLSGSACEDIQKNDLVIKDLKDIDISLYYPPEEFAHEESFEDVLGKYLARIENPESKVVPGVAFEAYAFKKLKFEGGISVRLNETSLDLSVKKEGGDKLSPYDSLWSSFRISLGEEYAITCPVPIQVLQHFRRLHTNIILTDIHNGLCRLNKCKKKQEDKGVPLFLLQPHLFEQLYERTNVTELAKYWPCDVTDKAACKKYYDENFTLLPKDELIKQWIELYRKESFSEAEQVTGLLLAELTTHYATTDNVCKAIVLHQQGKIFQAQLLAAQEFSKGNKDAFEFLKALQPTLKTVNDWVEYLCKQVLEKKKIDKDLLPLFLKNPPSNSTTRLQLTTKWVKQDSKALSLLTVFPDFKSLGTEEIQQAKNLFFHLLTENEELVLQKFLDLGRYYFEEGDFESLRELVKPLLAKETIKHSEFQKLLDQAKAETHLSELYSHWKTWNSTLHTDPTLYPHIQALCQKVLKQDENQFTALQMLTIVTSRQQHLSDVQNLIPFLEKKGFHHLEPLTLKALGKYYFRTKNFMKAARYFKQADLLTGGKINVTPKLYDCWVKLNTQRKDLVYKSQSSHDSKRAYQIILKQKESRSSYWLNLAESVFHSKQLDFKIPLKRAMQLNPTIIITDTFLDFLSIKETFEPCIELVAEILKEYPFPEFLITGLNAILKQTTFLPTDQIMKLHEKLSSFSQDKKFNGFPAVSTQAVDLELVLAVLQSLMKKDTPPFLPHYLPVLTSILKQQKSTIGELLFREKFCSTLLAWCHTYLEKNGRAPWLHKLLDLGFNFEPISFHEYANSDEAFKIFEELRNLQAILPALEQSLLKRIDTLASPDFKDDKKIKREYFLLYVDVFLLRTKIYFRDQNAAKNFKELKHLQGSNSSYDMYTFMVLQGISNSEYSVPLEHPDRILAFLFQSLLPLDTEPTQSELNRLIQLGEILFDFQKSLEAALCKNGQKILEWVHPFYDLLDYWKVYHPSNQLTEFFKKHKKTLSRTRKSGKIKDYIAFSLKAKTEAYPH